MNPYDHIEDYLQGKLSEEQKSIFEKALSEDTDLQQLVREYQGVTTVTDGLLEGELLAMVQRADNTTRLSSSRRRWWLIGMILLLVIVGGYLLYQKSIVSKNDEIDSQQLFAFYYQEPVWEVTRGDSSDLFISNAINYYEDGNISGALERLNEVDQNSSAYIKARQYIAEIMLSSDDGLEVIPIIEALQDSERKDWIMALAYLKSGNIEMTKSILKNIINQQNHIYQKSARELIDQL